MLRTAWSADLAADLRNGFPIVTHIGGVEAYGGVSWVWAMLFSKRMLCVEDSEKERKEMLA
jgi:hypothetical protein